MKLPRPRLTVRRSAATAAVLLLAAGVTAPYLHADRFARAIREALEASLRRKVDIEEARFNLFWGPGFSLRKVVIHEVPAFGLEPLAYVSSIEARIRLASLLGGRLEFASLRLVEPSVNFVKSQAGPWNFQPLLGLAAGARLPEIRVRGGRLNFKFGDTKSATYFTNADLDIDPPSSPSRAFELRFAGAPARTDRTGMGLGRLEGRGRWRPSGDRRAGLDLQLSLERTPLANLSTLLRGYDVGVHGDISGEARLSGTVSLLNIEGFVALTDLHRWDAMPPYAKGGTLALRGRLDLSSQTLELASSPGEAPALPVAVRFRAADYLSHPRWAATAVLKEAPLAPLVDIARHMGVSLAEPLEMEGTVDGVVGFAAGAGVQGILEVREARVRAPDSPPVQFREARVVLDSARLRLAQALMDTEDGETARLEAEYSSDTGNLDLRLSSPSLQVTALRSNAGPLLGLIQAPLPEQIADGVWEGSMRYRRSGNAPAEWSGDLRLRDATVSLPLLADRFSELSAAVSLQGDRLSMKHLRARVGPHEVEGEYRYLPGARRPHQFACRLASVDAAELERLVLPALRRPRGLLSRALRLGRAPLPSWLGDFHAHGTLKIDSLTLRGLQFDNVRALVFWDAARIELAGLEGALLGGSVSGRLVADLRGPEPAYEVSGLVRSLTWKTGTLDGDGLLRAVGTGSSLHAGLRLEGDFTGQGLELSPELPPASATGCYDLAYEKSQPRLRLKNLRVTAGAEIYSGEGETTSDGDVNVHLAAQQAQIRMAGRLHPFQLDVSSAPSASPR